LEKNQTFLPAKEGMQTGEYPSHVDRAEEVSKMEGMFLDAQYLPVMGSLILGGLLFLTVFGAVVYGWLCEKPAQGEAEREPLKKAA
jgi:hypothetical protein